MKRLALILLALGMNVQAAALTLNDARAQGRVGETLSGYLAPIQQDAETLALVNRINERVERWYAPLLPQLQSLGVTTADWGVGCLVFVRSDQIDWLKEREIGRAHV